MESMEIKSCVCVCVYIYIGKSEKHREREREVYQNAASNKAFHLVGRHDVQTQVILNWKNSSTPAEKMEINDRNANQGNVFSLLL